MRREQYEPRQSATVTLLIINAVVFVLQAIIEFWFGNSPAQRFVEHYLTLSPGGIAHGFVWQLVTFQFLHGGLLHLLLNCWGLYVFGSAIEETIGRSSLLKLYLGSGIVGGLLQSGLGLLLPKFYGASVVGASAGVLGLVAAFARMFPDRVLTLLIFFVIPVSLRARWLLWISAIMAGFGMLVPSDNVAHAAHLGGILGGVGFVHWFVNGDGITPAWARRWLDRPKALVTRGSTKGRAWEANSGEPPLLPPPGDFISQEVDPILDKISAHGIQSLTPQEREILEAARAKMAKR